MASVWLTLGKRCITFVPSWRRRTLPENLLAAQLNSLPDFCPIRRRVERKPSARDLHAQPLARASTAPTSASPPQDPGGLGRRSHAVAEGRLQPTTSQRLALLLQRLVLRTDHPGHGNVRRGSHTQSSTTAVATAAVRAGVAELSSAGATKGGAERAGQATGSTVTDVRGEALQHIRSISSDEMHKINI